MLLEECVYYDQSILLAKLVCTGIMPKKGHNFNTFSSLNEILPWYLFCTHLYALISFDLITM